MLWLATKHVLDTVLKDSVWQAWRILFENELDAEFPAFEILQTFVAGKPGRYCSRMSSEKSGEKLARRRVRPCAAACARTQARAEAFRRLGKTMK